MSKELWEFKYAPKTFKDMILHPDIKKKLEKALKEHPNMILAGSPGVGKGTFVNCLKEHTGAEFMKMNCSDETGIDSIRDKVKSFATALGLGGLKYVYLNEADYLSHNAQAMLRDLMEQVQEITRFVFACNYSEKIIPELKSRCQFIEISNPPARDVFEKCVEILEKEGVEYEKKTVVEIVKTCYPDIRKTFVTLRENTDDGVLPEKITVSTMNSVFQEVLEAMKTMDPENIRKILRSHSVDYTGLYKYLYETLMEDDQVFSKDAQAIVHIGEAVYRDNIVAIKEINFMHMYFKMLKDGTV